MTSSGHKLLLGVLLSGSLLAGVGCKHTAAPIRNADGSVTNADGSVTFPNRGQAAPNGQPVRLADGSVLNPDGSVTYAANSPQAVAERQNNPSNGPAPAPGAAPVVAGQPGMYGNGQGYGAGPTGAPGTTGAPAAGYGAPAGPGVVSGPAPAPGEPVAPEHVAVTVPAGTSVTVRINGSLAASRNEVGDRFSGVLERPVESHGVVLFERGTPVSGEVVASKGRGRFKGAGDLGIELTAIGRERVETSEYERVAKGRGKRTAGFIGGGAGVGALIGGLAGGGKGALIGGLAGAGGGTAASAYTGNRDVVIPAESVITFRLRTALSR